MTNPAIEKIMRRVPTFKPTNLDEMKTHVRYVAQHLDQLLDFNKRMRNPSFRRQLLCRRKIDEITNCLAVAGKDTVVYMGEYDNDNRDGRLKGSSSGPVQEITRCLGHKCTVVVTDEFRTSKLCHECHHLLVVEEDVLYDQESNTLARRLNRRSLHCPVCARRGHPSSTHGRDVSASHSIRKRGVERHRLTGPPPFPFQRKCRWGMVLISSTSALYEPSMRPSP